MKFILPSLTVVAISLSYFANAQTPFSTCDSMSVNNINARQLIHGDMWWNPATQLNSCEFPKGSGKHLAAGGALWMSGYDGVNGLHIAAQTYRQHGTDYWPGPLDSNGTLSYATSQNWARFWKVNASDISTFNAITTHTVANTPAVILEWPAKGNTHAKGFNGVSLSITQDMAPFVDVNSDGIYDALQGDYPAIKGDQALWWVFSDNGPTHTESNGQPLKVEIHAMAFAYNRGSLIDNVVYYEYNIYNRSTGNYNNFRIGQWADMDLGWYADDYIGFDSSHRMGIVYNGVSPDGSGQVNSYGSNIPVAGVTMVILPGDNPPTTFAAAGSFMYYNNDFSLYGNPTSPAEYNNYLRSIWRDTTHVVNDFQGHGIASTGHGTGPLTNYVYGGDPSDTSKWSECASQNTPGDRRFIITSNDFTLNSGSSQKVVMALVSTNLSPNNSCPNTQFDGIKIVADTAWKIYFNPLPVSVNNPAIASNKLSIYPNPAHDRVFVDAQDLSDENIIVYNSLGQTTNVTINRQQSKTELDISMLPNGVYYVLLRSRDIQKSASFIKD